MTRRILWVEAQSLMHAEQLALDGYGKPHKPSARARNRLWRVYRVTVDIKVADIDMAEEAENE